MNLRILATSFILLCTSALFFSFSPNTALATSNKETLRIGIDAPYPPFAYTDKITGELTGFDVDMAEAVCKQLKRECKTSVIAFDEIIPSILTDKIDIGLVGMSKTPEREKLVLFSDKYFRSSSIFISYPDSISVENDGLKDKKIAVQSQTRQEDYLKKTYGDIAIIVPIKTFPEIIEAVKNKKVDIAFTDGLPGYYQLRKEDGKELDLIGEPIKLGDGSCIVMDKKFSKLQAEINQAIQEIRKNGEYDRINRKYFQFNVY